MELDYTGFAEHLPQPLIHLPDAEVSWVNEQRNNTQPLYFKVYLKNMYKQEKGHFKVGVELITRLYLQLKARGYQVKDIGINGSRIRPDIAIGKRFHNLWIILRYQITDPLTDCTIQYLLFWNITSSEPTVFD